MLYTSDDAVFIIEIEIRNFDAYRSQQSMAFLICIFEWMRSIPFRRCAHIRMGKVR